MKLVLALVLVAACSPEKPSKEEWKAPSPATAPPATTRIDIAVTEAGYEPAQITVPKGQPVTLVFTRKTGKTCAKDVVVEVDEKTRIKKDLPLGEPVDIAATFPKAGELHYACGMNMVTGVVTVR